MPSENEAGPVSNLRPVFVMKGRVTEEVQDYLFYLQEVTNAYATELIWTLALVLGFTCLYIWRALGLQEAARKHSYMVSSRPVFSAVPTPSVASSNSPFVSAYKNRFAHRDLGRDEERINAVGYDVLHTYNVSPYQRHTVPRAVWKRHMTGSENEHLTQPQCGSRNRLWDSDPLSAGHWSNQPRVSTPFASAASNGSSSARKGHIPVPAQRTRRPENTEIKTVPVSQLSYLFSRAPHQLQQYRQKAQTPQLAPQPNRRVNHTCVSNCPEHAEGNRPVDKVTYSSDYNVRHKLAPRGDEEMMDNQPARLSDNLFLLSHAVKEVRQGWKTLAERMENENKERHGDQIVLAGVKNNALSNEDVLTETGYPNKTEQASPNCVMNKGNGFSEGPQFTEKMKNRELEKRPRKRCTHPNETTGEQNKNANIDVQSDSSSYSYSSGSKTGDKDQEMGELRAQDLLNQDNSSARYKSASSVLEKFAKSFFTDHRKEMNQETSHTQSQYDNECLMSKNTCQMPRKTSSTRLCRRRSKTIQTGDSSQCLTDESKNAYTSHTVHREAYDSAVLRAIKDEEESKKSEHHSENSLNTTGMHSEPARSESESKKHSREAPGNGECDQTAVHEAGRRLAKLRKRLQDSIQLIQKQPSLDTELLVKAYSTKMRRQRDELETMFMKDDVIDLVSLDGVKNMKHETRSNLAAQSELADNCRSSLDTGSAIKQDVRQIGPKVCNGKSSGSRGRPLTVSSCNGEDVSGTAAKTQESANSFVTTEKTTKAPEEKEAFGGNERVSLHPTNKPPEGSNTLRPNAAKTSSDPRKDMSQQTENNGKNDGNSTADKKIQCDKGASQSDAVRYLSNSGMLDEERLDAILERQHKRRENLRQRRRLRADLISAAETGSKDTPADKDSPDLRKVSEAERPSAIRENNNRILEQHTKDSKAENDTEVKAKDSESAQLSSSIIMDGSSFIVGSKSKPSGEEPRKMTSRESGSIRESQPAQIDMSDICPYISTRSLGYLKYEEPVIHFPKAESPKNNTSVENRITVMGGELKIVPERESVARRRVRWRRQAEKADKQRQEGDSQKEPPPIPPKAARQNDNTSKGTESTDLSNGDSPNESKDMELNEDKNKDVEGKYSTGTKTAPSPRLVRGSFNRTIKNKNTVLGAGETGVVKAPPENVEICEEKSLTPSKAAAVFDPKVQQAKEKEKQQVERARKATSREGMPSAQFKANLLLFEQATEAPGDRLQDSKVKTNVRMFEEVTKAHRAHSVSPERRRTDRKKRSPSSPGSTVECFLAEDK